MNEHLVELIERFPALADCTRDIEKTFVTLGDCYSSGSKVLICGNGGSAADAEHWAGELMKSFHKRRPLPPEAFESLGEELAGKLQGALPTIPLTGYLSLSSAFANDADPEYTFAQILWGIGTTGDALVAISTSGNSKNILIAAETARAKGITVIGMTGADGGKLAELADITVRVPATIVHHVQEFHVPIYHTLSMMLEEAFFPAE